MELRENGTYSWTGTFDPEYENSQYRIVAYVLGAFSLFLIIFGAVLCFLSRDWEGLAAFAGPAVAVMAITMAVIGFFQKTGAGSKRGYTMNDTCIQMGADRSAGLFFFSSAKHVIFTKTYIEPVQKIGGFRIYVPEEDMPFVKNYVLQRLPATCVKEDRSYVT